MLHILFLAIQQYLIAQLNGNALLNDASGGAFNYVRMWNSQTLYLEEGKSYDFPMPAIFVEFQDPVPWEEIGNGVKISNPLVIKLHLVMEELDDTGGTMEQNLDVYAIEQAIFFAFNDWMPNGLTIASDDPLYGKKWAGTYNTPAGIMEKRSDYQDKEHTNVYHYIMEYETTWLNTSRNQPVGGSIAPGTLAYEFDNAQPYNNAQAYVPSNAVTYNGNIYTCIANTTGNLPTNVTYWQFVEKVPVVDIPSVPDMAPLI